MRFTLELELGNEALLTSEDLSAVLEKVGKRITSQDYVQHLLDEGSVMILSRADITRGIKDANGNTVGSWTLSS
jgi:hypothetical protein